MHPRTAHLTTMPPQQLGQFGLPGFFAEGWQGLIAVVARIHRHGALQEQRRPRRVDVEQRAYLRGWSC
jgi:hypothetical protein